MLQGAGEGLPACPPWALAHRQAGDTPFPLPGGEGEDGEAQGGCPRGVGGEGSPPCRATVQGEPPVQCLREGGEGQGGEGEVGKATQKGARAGGG